MTRVKHPKINTGDRFKTNEGYDVEVLDYANSKDVLIQFVDGHEYITTAQSVDLRRGNIKNPFHPSVFGIGYIGVGVTPPSIGGKDAPIYRAWKDMLNRAYGEKYKKKRPTYNDVTVCNEWHNFQNFAAWYKLQKNAGKTGYSLDKDLTTWGNRQYCPENCSYVPNAINTLVTGNKKRDLPPGVHRKGNKYIALVCVDGNLKGLGSFNSPEEAAYAYNNAKKDYIIVVADKYREELDPKVYENLMKWEF